jgi:hypothetical protein
MHPRPDFAFKPDFKPHSRSSSFHHHFLCFKVWLTSNWSQELTYNVYSINKMLWYRVWPTRFLTRFVSSWSHQFKAYEIQPSLKQSLVTMEKVFEVSIWSIMARIARFHFWIRNSPFSFLPNRWTILHVFYLIVFSSPCSFQRYIICGFSSHGTIDSIFGFETMGSSGLLLHGTGEFSNLAPLHFDF